MPDLYHGDITDNGEGSESSGAAAAYLAAEEVGRVALDTEVSNTSDYF